MGMMIALILGFSAIGYGALLFKALRIDDVGSPSLVIGLCFAAGYGLIGWLVFTIGVAGLLEPKALWALVATGLVSLIALRGRLSISPIGPLTVVQIGLLALLMVVGIFDVLQALAPPSDADSLAYHFALPKQFLAAGEIFFVPRAIDGAVPLLVQMGYIPALGLGGEQALTFWAMLASWALYILVYGLARTKMSRAWSLAATLAVATTPTVIYGSGSGQVEVRIALFVLLAAWAAVRALETGHARYLILCGCGVGFYGASKYVGLVFMASTGVIILMQKHWFRAGTIYSIAALVSAGQWYLWNYMHTGDPIFPMLFPVLGVSDPMIWNADYQQMLNDVFFASETPVPVNLLGFLSYPFIATFNPPFHLDAGRTGLGPLLILLLPFAVAAAVSCKSSNRWNDIAILSALAFGFFTLWFFVGSPQRIRHLLPIWPLAVILLFYATQHCARTWKVDKPVGLVILGVLAIQVGGAGIFGIKFVDVALGRISHAEFRDNTISHFAPVSWVNENLESKDKVLTTERQHLYNLNIPSFFAQEFAQAVIPLNPATKTQVLAERMNSEGITHVIVYTDPQADRPSLPGRFEALHLGNCLEPIHSGPSKAIASRTLSGQITTLKFHVFQFTPDRCRPGG